MEMDGQGEQGQGQQGVGSEEDAGGSRGGGGSGGNAGSDWTPFELSTVRWGVKVRGWEGKGAETGGGRQPTT